MQSLPFQPLVTAHRALAMMLEGASLRAVSRLTGVPAIAEHFSENIDFAQLVTMYAKRNTSGPDWWRPKCLIPGPESFLERYAAKMITPRVPK